MIVLLALGLGYWYFHKPQAQVPTPTPTSTATSTQADQNKNIFTEAGMAFSFAHPKQFALSSGGTGLSQDWSAQATATGSLLAVVTIPREFLPQTNFSEAKFSVGTSTNADAIKNCLIYPYGGQVSNSQVIINDHQFTKLTFGDAGAGNFYETTSYRTVDNNQCYAVEYTIHSTNIGNYSPDQGIKEFDKTKITSILEGMVQSFKLR